MYMFFSDFWIFFNLTIPLRDFVKLKKFQKSEKNLKVGGWVKPQPGFLLILNIVFFCIVFFDVHVSKKNKKNG